MCYIKIRALFFLRVSLFVSLSALDTCFFVAETVTEFKINC